MELIAYPLAFTEHLRPREHPCIHCGGHKHLSVPDLVELMVYRGNVHGNECRCSSEGWVAGAWSLEARPLTLLWGVHSVVLPASLEAPVPLRSREGLRDGARKHREGRCLSEADLGGMESGKIVRHLLCKMTIPLARDSPGPWLLPQHYN